MRPLSSDLREFIRLLNTNSVKYVIVGAWALAFHGRPRYTGDLDIFVSRDDENADKLMAVITSKFCCRDYPVFPMKVATTVVDVLISS